MRETDGRPRRTREQRFWDDFWGWVFAAALGVIGAAIAWRLWDRVR